MHRVIVGKRKKIVFFSNLKVWAIRYLNMVDNHQFMSFCYLLFLQVAFINTKSQLFSLKNNKIIMSHNLEDQIQIDEIFYIISTTEPQIGSNSWTKESDNYDFTIDVE